jgi:excinuclease UvrABC nuclease subunit
MTTWTEYRLLEPRERIALPKCAGVYVIYFDGRPVYVGQSVNVANRLAGHKLRHAYARYIITPWVDVPDTTRITVKVKPSRRLGDWAMLEIRLIARLQPEFNTHHLRRRAA